ANRLKPARVSNRSRSSRVVRRNGSTLLIRKGSMTVFMASRSREQDYHLCGIAGDANYALLCSSVHDARKCFRWRRYSRKATAGVNITVLAVAESADLRHPDSAARRKAELVNLTLCGRDAQRDGHFSHGSFKRARLSTDHQTVQKITGFPG